MHYLQRRITELGLTQDLLKQGLDLLTKPRAEQLPDGSSRSAPPTVVINGERVALAETASAEGSIARHIHRLLGAELRELELPADLWADFSPHETQVEAIEQLAASMVAIITGGPGVGKTTIVKRALRLFQANGLKVLQVAPTGKAAKRLADSTGFPAQTIHRALGRGQNGAGWQFHAGQPFPIGVLVVDEASMIDVFIMAAVLDACRTGTRVVIVGDVDQLPSVDPGRVLHDLIVSQVVPTVRLTKIFRQAGPSCSVHGAKCPGRGCPTFDPGSRIPYFSRDLNSGRLPDNLDGEGTDVRFIQRDLEADVLDLVLKAVCIGIPKQKGIQPHEIQVLAAQKSKGVGVEDLNKALQAALNPTTDHELDVSIGSGYLARTKDRVVQRVRNNYDLQLMNGDAGTLLASDPRGLDMDQWPEAWTSEKAAEAAKGPSDHDPYDASDIDGSDDDSDARRSPQPELSELEADLNDGSKNDLKKSDVTYVLVGQFDGRQVAFNKSEARELHLNYAGTIHSAQGSQYRAIVFIGHSCHQFMLTRPLVYTAVTRAEQYVLIIGQAAALAKAARNTRGTDRRTQLQSFMMLPRS